MLSRMSKKRAVEDDVVKVTDLPYKVRKLLEKSQKIKEKIEEKEENKRIKCLEDMQKALQQILVEGKSPYAVELDTGFGRKTLARWASLNSIESVTGNISQMVLNQRGRKAVVVDKIVEKVKSDTTLNDMLGKSAKNIMPVRASAKVTLPNYDPNEDTNTITSRVNSIVTDYVKETKPDAAPVSLSETTIRRILKKADTYTVKKGRSQNADIQKILQPVPKASRDTFMRYFMTLPYIFDTAFSKSTITSGYSKTGIGWPFSVDRILRNCPNIEMKHGPAEMECIKSSVYEIAMAGMQFTAEGQGGTILDETMEEHLAKFFGPVHNNSGNATTDQVVNQWKATILTDAGTVARQRDAATIKEAAALRAQVKREQTAQAKENKQATTRVKCGGKIALLCVREEFKQVLDKRQSPTWWICPVKGCNAAFCGSCSGSLRSLHEQAHRNT